MAVKKYTTPADDLGPAVFIVSFALVIFLALLSWSPTVAVAVLFSILFIYTIKAAITGRP